MGESFDDEPPGVLGPDAGAWFGVWSGWGVRFYVKSGLVKNGPGPIRTAISTIIISSSSSSFFSSSQHTELTAAEPVKTDDESLHAYFRCHASN